jgi:hypothetical protein
MNPRLLAVLALVATWLVLLSPHAALADSAKEAELLKRIEQLEKRIAELEKKIEEHPSGQEPAKETAKKLVGNWVITDEDKKTAADKKIPVWTDLKFNGDGTCAMVFQNGTIYPTEKYQVIEIGNVTRISSEQIVNGASTWEFRLASVTESELVLEYAGGVKMHYTHPRKK